MPRYAANFRSGLARVCRSPFMLLVGAELCVQLDAREGHSNQIIEGHIRFHVLRGDESKNSSQLAAAEELIDVVRAYLR
jgi:hypothetical protein